MRVCAYLQLVAITPRLHVLLANMHHAITDGWSAAVLQRELALAYAAVTSSTAPAWAPLPVQVPSCADDVPEQT